MAFGVSRFTAATIATTFALLGAACHGDPEPRAEPGSLPARSGPTGLVRVALAELPWPLDPARVEGRDATTVARALFATPLRTHPLTGALRPGLCRTWRPDRRATTWRFRCRHAASIAGAIRRLRGVPDSPLAWLVEPVADVALERPDVLVVRLGFPWRRFAYALTAPAFAPRTVPGPFRLVTASRDRIVAERPGLRLVFVRLAPRIAADAFRRGVLDEAPVPVGRMIATRRDPALSSELRVRPVRAVDAVDLGTRLAASRDLRLAYWRTAQRADYEALVPEFAAPQAYGIVRTERAAEGASPRLFRSTREALPDLPRLTLTIEVERDPEAVYRAQILSAAWRDLGLRPRVVARLEPGRTGAARFTRLAAPYPLPEALLAAAVMARTDAPLARSRLVAALGARDPLPLLASADEALQADARVIPVAWVADARLVSRRLRGWRRDALGVVDYTRVRAERRS